MSSTCWLDLSASQPPAQHWCLCLNNNNLDLKSQFSSKPSNQTNHSLNAVNKHMATCLRVQQQPKLSAADVAIKKKNKTTAWY